MSKTLKDISILISSALLLTCLIWLPHYLSLPDFWGLNFSNGFATIYQNYDGTEYITIAKTFYKGQDIYYASHFPGYSILIAGFAPILGFLKSMLFVSILATIASVITFYFLVRDFKLTGNPLFLSILFLFLPARWVIVHSVGSSEPLFIFFIITCIYFFMKFEQSGKFLFIFLAGISGFFAQITRPPGILLFIALLLYLIWNRFAGKISSSIIRIIGINFPIIFIPLGLILVFTLYSQTYHDFFAYFKSGNNIHLVFPPFQVFNKTQFWVGDAWLEDIVYIFILGFLGGVHLWKQKLYSLSFFVLVYLSASIFVAHRDISRYLLPIFPFILIAFEKVLVSREFKIVFVILALAIYLYSQNFIISNTAPIPNLNIFN